MALSAADRKWFRKMVRDELTKIIQALPEEGQMTSYDGATPVIEDDWAEEGKKAKRPSRRKIGFTTGEK